MDHPWQATHDKTQEASGTNSWCPRGLMWLGRQLQQGNVTEKVPPQSTLTCEAILVPLYVQTPTAQPPVGVFPVAVLRQLILRRPREAMNPTHICSNTFSSSSPAKYFQSTTFSKKTQVQDFVNQLPSSRRTRWRPPTPTNPSGHSPKAQACQGFNAHAHVTQKNAPCS